MDASWRGLPIVLAAIGGVALVDCGLPGAVGGGGAGGAGSASTTGPSDAGGGATASSGAGLGGSSAGSGGGSATGTGGAPGSGGGGGATPTDVVIEAETGQTNAPGAYSWTPSMTVPGYSGASYMQCGPGTGAPCTDPSMLDSCAASMTYVVTLAASSTYWFQIRMYATDTSQDSIWYGVDGVVAMPEIDVPHDSTWHWITGESLALAAGAHTITLWQRECGARVDVLALTTTPTPPPP